MLSEGDGHADVGDVGSVVAVHEYMGGTCGSGIVSSADDMLENVWLVVGGESIGFEL